MPTHVPLLRGINVGGRELAAVAAARQRARDQGSDDEARVVGTTLFLHTPAGLGRSELAAQLTVSVAPERPRRLAPPATGQP